MTSNSFDDYDGALLFDIDGVANRHAHTLDVLERHPPSRNEEDLVRTGTALLQREYVDRVAALCHTTRTRLVITSSWRHHCSVALIRRIFAAHEFPAALIRDAVPYDAWLGDRRAENSRVWLAAHAPKRYAVVDDDWTGWGTWKRVGEGAQRMSIFIPDPEWAERFVRVNDGLSSQEAAKLVEILGAVKDS